MVFAMALFLAKGTVIASRRIFQNTLQHVLHNPMSFFDKTPTGRILSRLGKDIDVIDNVLPVILRAWISCLFSVWYSYIKYALYCISNDFCDNVNYGLALRFLLVERYLLQINVVPFITDQHLSLFFRLSVWSYHQPHLSFKYQNSREPRCFSFLFCLFSFSVPLPMNGSLFK